MEPERVLGELSTEGKVWEGQATGVREGALRTMPVASKAGEENRVSRSQRSSAGSQDGLHLLRSNLYTSSTKSKRGGGSGQSLAVLCGTGHCGQQPTDSSAGYPEETKALSGAHTPPPPSPNFSAFGSRGRAGKEFLLLPLAGQ